MSNVPTGRLSFWTILALFVSAAGVAGSLWLSLGMELLACPLCYYQRTFAMAALGTLAVGLLGGVRPSSRVSLLALPSAIGGLGLAGWHISRELLAPGTKGAMDCPQGLFGIGTAPQQSLAVFALLTLLLLIDIGCGCCCGGDDSRGPSILGSLLAIVLGLAFAYGCVESAFMPPLPENLKTGDLKICRPPQPIPAPPPESK